MSNPRQSVLALSISCALFLAAPELQANTTDQLLASARLWEGKNRPDLSRLALDKALLISPGNPEILSLIGQTALTSGRQAEAQSILVTLKKSHPEHEATRELEDFIHALTIERKALSTARILARSGRNTDAAAIMRRIFPRGAPTGELGIEYWLIIASSNERGWKEARSGLQSLIRRYPEDDRYHLALNQLLLDLPAARPAVLKDLARLAKAGEVNRQKLNDLWRRGLLSAGNQAYLIPLFGEYLLYTPEDRDIRERLGELQRTEEARQRIAHDPAIIARRAALAHLEKGNIDEAERLLDRALEKRPRDAEAIGSLGLIALRRGEHQQAEQQFLQAARLASASDRQRWRDLADTARFWGYLAQAEQARDKGDLADAESFAQKALGMEHDRPEALATLGGIAADKNEFSRAEVLYRQALNLEAENSKALRGLISLLSRTERRDEAFRLANTQLEKGGENIERATQLKASLLRDEAESLITAGRYSQAIANLESAVSLAPQDAWLRYSLARLYARLDLPALGDQLLREGVSLAPESDEMHHAYALYLGSRDAFEDALREVDLIPESARKASIDELESRLWVQLRGQQARELFANGNRDEARRMLLLAEPMAARAEDQIPMLANTWVDIGYPEHGILLLQQHIARQPENIQRLKLAQAALLNRTQRDTELEPYLRDLLAEGKWTTAEEAELLSIEASYVLRHVDQLRQDGSYALAQAHLEKLLNEHLDDPMLLKAQARLLTTQGDWLSALPIYRHLAAQNPLDFDTRLDLVRTLREVGFRAESLAELQVIEPQIRHDDIDLRLSVARQYQGLGELAAARRILADLQQQAPNNPDVLLNAGRLEKNDRRYEQALAYFVHARLVEQSPLTPALLSANDTADAAWLRISLTLNDERHASQQLIPDDLEDIAAPSLKAASSLGAADVISPEHRPFLETFNTAPQTVVPPVGISLATRPSQAEEEIRNIERRQNGYIASGWENRSKRGDAGISALSTNSIPVEGKLPVGYSGHVFARVDYVSIKAGTLPASTPGAPVEFGKIPAYGSSSSENQSATGTAVAIGYENDDYRFDIGSTPLGFPVQDIVGGVKTSGSIGSAYYSLDISRRPLDSSMLAYAGAKDPVTGEVWGGIRANGINLWAGWDVGQLGLYGSIGAHLLTGKNVPQNSRFATRVGADWMVTKKEDMRIAVGAAVTYWTYDQDLSNYTFGQGGYYSPQSYSAISLPIFWTGRNGKLAYYLRGSVSFSRSNSDESDYFPTRHDLQMAAGDQKFSGGPGSGVGYAGSAILEYQLLPDLFIGGRFEFDRSAYYAPNYYLIYLRHTFEPRTEPIPFKPVPLKAYSQF
jgi:tetratricopeptide (TPR) repeat protein